MTPRDGTASQPDGQLAPRLAMLRGWLESGMIGAPALVERLLIALLASGHLLIEGSPGLGKTRAVKRLAAGLGGSFARVQCTPDLMPSDLTGTQVFRPDSGGFDFVPGPVFHQLLLVDEINRAPPKVQSALLEAMAEHQVTAGTETRALPDPFMVVATQNPIEHEGTFPLPEAQLDRFLFHVPVALPDAESERGILDLWEREGPFDGVANPPDPLSAGEVRAARADVGRVWLAPALKAFIVDLVTATRGGDAAPEVRTALEHPVSPRGSIALAAGARARAWLNGRDHALPEDVEALAADALAHRMILTWRAAAEGQSTRALVARLLERVRPL